MIHEIASFLVRPGQPGSFAQAFAGVAHLLSRAKGYQGHSLMQGIEEPSHFTLVVRWQSLEDHTPGFEASEDHRVFMLGLQEHLAAEPAVYHVRSAGDAQDAGILPA
jgi:heme-degrading monooxygenase HmoA